MKAPFTDLHTQEQRVISAGLSALSVSLAGWSAASAWFALDHMARLGAICGQAAPHCGWCVSAALAGAAALAAGWTGLRFFRETRRVRVLGATR